MIAKFFNKTKPINTLIVFVLLSIVFIAASFSIVNTGLTIDFFLRELLLLTLLLITFFVINFITRKNGLTKGNSYVLLLLVMCIGMFPLATLSVKLLITHFFLLLAYRRIYSLRTAKDTKEKLFDSSLWIGITTLIYPLSFIYFILIYGAIIAFNKLTIRNVLIPLVGFATPIIIYIVYLLMIDDLGSFNIGLNYSFSFLNYNSLKLLLPIALILGFLLWSTFPTTIKIITVNNEFRTSWFLVLFHLLISLLVIMPSPIKNGSEILFLFFPTVIIFTNYIQLVSENWFKEVFLYLFLAVTIVVYFL